MEGLVGQRFEAPTPADIDVRYIDRVIGWAQKESPLSGGEVVDDQNEKA